MKEIPASQLSMDIYFLDKDIVVDKELDFNPSVGHNVISLKKPGLICTLINIKSDKYFVLAPITNRGFPSINLKKWEYWHISQLKKLRNAKKYPKLYICPKCGANDKPFRVNALQCPLRRISIYDEMYQCKKCKETFLIRDNASYPQDTNRKP